MVTVRVKDIIGYSARRGLSMGLYLILIFGCLFGSFYIDALSVVGLLLLGGIPWLLYQLLKPLTVGQDEVRGAAIWLAGIYCFLFGALISGFALAVFLIYIEPGYMTRYLEKYLEIAASLPDPTLVKEQTEMISLILEKRLVPSAMETVFSLIWATGFFGSLLSGIVALVLKRRAGRPLLKKIN